jgi:acyl-CoA reductase-like NAD-dependent aldehyde dehydrogenase
MEHVNPASGQLQADFPVGTPELINEAVTTGRYGQRSRRAQQQIRSGITGAIKDTSEGDDGPHAGAGAGAPESGPSAPFGGFKDSGYGKQGSWEGLMEPQTFAR